MGTKKKVANKKTKVVNLFKRPLFQTGSKILLMEPIDAINPRNIDTSLMPASLRSNK